ncbi:hypothetical protein BSKO_10869 [Bryopsis sp. KO-2023]|nr:hypothetical protein BSKO_10869 [Bryopsis sp. KO-2023]
MPEVIREEPSPPPPSPLSSPMRNLESFSNEPRPDRWRLGDVKWGFVFGAQHYGTLVLTLFPAVALGIILFGVGEDPQGDELQNVLSDPTFDRFKRKGSVPAVAAVMVPVAYFLLILFSVEFYLFRPTHRHVTNAVYTSVFFVIGLFCAFVVHIFAQQISAIVVAEPRPDFKTRCIPTPDSRCTGDVSDAFGSFFSGHASSSMVTAVYSTVYLLWSVYFRLGDPKRGKSSSRLLTQVQYCKEGYGVIDRLLHEIGHGAVMYVVILQIGYAWIVGVSRIIDNRHHIWDVNAGLIVGSIVGVLFGLQAIGVYKLMPKYGYSRRKTIVPSPRHSSRV